jgi:hypothetical protein
MQTLKIHNLLKRTPIELIQGALESPRIKQSNEQARLQKVMQPAAVHFNMQKAKLSLISCI